MPYKRPTYKNLTDDQHAALDAYLSEHAQGNADLTDLLHIAIGRGLAKRIWFLGNLSAGEIRHIAGWLKAAIHNDEPWLKHTDPQGRRPSKLWQIGSLDAATAIADKAMRQAAHSLRSNFQAATLDEAIKTGDIEIYEQFGNGYALVRLNTPKALKDESAQLGHCIGDGAYDDTLYNPYTLLLSLRDPNNKPHVTLEIHNGTLEEMKGKENAPPAAKYMRMLHPFLRQTGWKLGEAPSHTGLLEQDDVIYDVANLPDGFAYRKSLTLVDAKWLKKLPNNLSVRQPLNLTGCTNIRYLPKKIAIEKHMRIPDIIYADEGVFSSWGDYRTAFYKARPHLNPDAPPPATTKPDAKQHPKSQARAILGIPTPEGP